MMDCKHDWQIYSARCVKCGVNADEACRLIQQELQPSPDKLIIHKDELDRMNRNMAEKDRQTSEVYEIMKFEQERANRAVSLLNAVLLYGKECPHCKAQVIVTATFYSLAHEHGCEIGKMAGMTIAR
jgi:Zn ribbon nucleic-acid-binding protein